MSAINLTLIGTILSRNIETMPSGATVSRYTEWRLYTTPNAGRFLELDGTAAQSAYDVHARDMALEWLAGGPLPTGEQFIPARGEAA